MPVDTSASVEQLLKRFEALRGLPLIELLTVEALPGSKLPAELPPHHWQFSSCRRTAQVLYGQPKGTGSRVMEFRFRGGREEVSRFCNAAQAAAQLLAVPLAEAGFIHPADCRATHKDAFLCTWLVAMLTSAEGGSLLSDGIRGGGWAMWSEGSALMFRGMAGHSAGQGLANDGAVDVVELLTASAEPSARYAVFENVVETSLALLHVLAAPRKKVVQEAKEPKPKKTFRNLTECILHIYKTQGGREQMESCTTLGEVCQVIKELYPEQPAQTPGVCGAWPKQHKKPWKQKRLRPKEVPESRLGDNIDLDSLTARSSTSGHPLPLPQLLKCAACNEAIPPGGHVQSEGKVYCPECGVELLHGIVPQP